MKLLIDSANIKDIDSALSLGIDGVTANPSMYAKEGVNFYDFLKTIKNKTDGILTAEVMENTLEKMREDANKILTISNDIVIKINFSEKGLTLAKELKKQGVKTAITLIFNVNQAIIAMNTGTDYIFPFIGRNEAIGADGLEILKNICNIITNKHYKTKVVAASLKHVYHLEQAAILGADYAAIPYTLLKESCYHLLTEKGEFQFREAWAEVDIL